MTVTLGNLIAVLAVFVPVMSGAIYFAVRMAIRKEVLSLELRVSDKYVQKETCKAIRTDCHKLYEESMKRFEEKFSQGRKRKAGAA